MKKDNKNIPYIIQKKSKLFEDNVIPQEVDINLPEIKQKLNTKIWDNYTLKKNIRYHFLKIALEFYKFLKLQVPLKDIIFTGSLANYNYTIHSDIDIHLILDLSQFGNEKEFIEEYLIAKKDIWNDKRYITIKGYEVELYAKDKESLTTNKGVYSILKNKWIQKPIKNHKKIDGIAIKEKVALIANEIDELQEIDSDEVKMEKAKKIKKKLSKMRKSGLEKNGEFSNENITFKTLRNMGYLEQLSSIYNTAYNTSLSVKESLNEGKTPKYEHGCLMLQLNTIPDTKWKNITDKIKEQDVYKKEGYGIEEEPHVTILYGFKSDKVKPEEIMLTVKEVMDNDKEIEIQITGISIFENDKFDVVKFDIQSEKLSELNKALRKYPHINTFPEYHPHMTIAYVKKGKGKKYVKDIKSPIKFYSNLLKYSFPPSNVLYFDLQATNDITIGFQKDIEEMSEDKKNYVKKFVIFTVNRLGLKYPVSLFLHKGRDEYIVTTASYVPSENSNHVRASNRALVDILRSIGHEFTHNKQREIGSFDINGEVQNIGGWIEDEANAIAGILIKDFALNLGNEEIYDM